jgi:hypothetical protein
MCNELTKSPSKKKKIADLGYTTRKERKDRFIVKKTESLYEIRILLKDKTIRSIGTTPTLALAKKERDIWIKNNIELVAVRNVISKYIYYICGYYHVRFPKKECDEKISFGPFLSIEEAESAKYNFFIQTGFREEDA